MCRSRILIEGAFLSPFGFETIVNSWICLEKGDEKSKNEILKLKKLPNERLEGSWRALWLGFRTFFGFKLSVVVLPRISTFGKPNANMKTFGKSNATEKCSRNPIFPSQRYNCRPKNVRGTKCKSENVREIKCNRKIAAGGGEMCVPTPFACLLFVVCLSTGKTKDRLRR